PQPVPGLHPEAARARAGAARPEQQAGVRPAPGRLGQGREGHPRARAAAHDREGQPRSRPARRDRVPAAGAMTGTPDAPAPSLRLAVVEDDAELRERILLPALQASGFEASGFRSALELYRQWTRAPFDLVLLDVGLPDEDGVEIARHLRAPGGTMGIVIYSAHGRSADRLRGLRAGVDAYLVKPLEMAEEVQTLRNLDRRVRSGVADAAGSSGWSLTQRGWVLETPAGASIGLSRSEREVMTALAARAGDTVPRETLMQQLAGEARDGFDPHRLDMLIYRLRRKCEAAGAPLSLATVRGA